MIKYLVFLFMILGLVANSQSCYNVDIKFDPIIFSFCDSDDNCLSFDIYADETLVQSIDLDTYEDRLKEFKKIIRQR